MAASAFGPENDRGAHRASAIERMAEALLTGYAGARLVECPRCKTTGVAIPYVRDGSEWWDIVWSRGADAWMDTLLAEADLPRPGAPFGCGYDR